MVKHPHLDVRLYQYNQWTLQDNWTFSYRNRFFCIPAGFNTDFFTLPRLARLLWLPNPGQLSIASVVHDFLLRNRSTLGISYAFANAALRDTMIALGYPVRAHIFHAACTLGAWAYSKRTREKKSN